MAKWAVNSTDSLRKKKSRCEEAIANHVAARHRARRGLPTVAAVGCKQDSSSQSSPLLADPARLVEGSRLSMGSSLRLTAWTTTKSGPTRLSTRSSPEFARSKN